ncbi:MAG: hypothetical protein Q9203_003865 [Teloschistes exilis]
MRLTSLYLLAACCTLGSITGVFSLATPHGYSDSRLEERDTKSLRKCVKARPLYKAQDQAQWYEVDKSKTKLEVTATTEKNKNPPKPSKNGGLNQGDRYVVDHVLELQIVVAAFEDGNRKYDDNAKAISKKAWQKAKDAVNGKDKEGCKSVAQQITVLDNLLGVAEKINLGKETVYQKVLSGQTDKPLKDKWNDFLKAFAQYLKDYKSKVDTTIDNTAQALKDLTDDNNDKDKVKDYFSAFCKAKYKEGQDYIQGQIDKQK